MPELPEVETIKNFLDSRILNSPVVDFNFKPSRLLNTIELKFSQKEFKRKVMNNQINKIIRRGKYLLFYFQEAVSFIIHLGMSGKILLFQEDKKIKTTSKNLNPITKMDVFTPNKVIKKHLYLSFRLKNKVLFHFYDPRTFGKIILISSPYPHLYPKITNLGKDPLDTPLKKLHQLWPIRSSLKIKTFLLQQNYLAGIGNIYSDESLFWSKINPTRKMQEINQFEWKRLIQGIRKILRKSIQHLGTSFSSFRNPNNQKGKNQNKLLVYGRGNEPCQQCGKKLKEIKLVGRTTVFCINCQK